MDCEFASRFAVEFRGGSARRSGVIDGAEARDYGTAYPKRSVATVFLALTENIEGALFMAAGMAAMAVGDALSKVVVTDITVAQLLFIGGMSLPCFFAL
ncbi:Hypothetical protein NGAL_HAMBI1145_55670 [Neorhizobium galegae bv. officinalis]|uniref:Uncharacterized protein n=1 Tax=Neorhizobium galegae bv. officinalis TaxID=323656 RepID=A0A0T7G0M5_NEOGA|nr:hypothetical protein [Neorhizobium galegae]CDZ40793.1 Hypothetical protein NGAL_HAMBI1145_55670 [Neorhizobium galegae bv. officinalis]CDZ54629.1 Hypothetical protein NGAL_HAMBI1189_56060 [Neorhizobium galegae bv. officinalis]